MNTSANSALSKSGDYVYRIEGKALQQWWQVDAFLSVKKKPDTLYTNHAARCAFLFLLTVPVYIYMGATHNQWHAGGQIRFIALGLVTWFSGLCAFALVARRHLRLLLEVRLSDEGLDLNSLFLHRKIRWLDVVDFFPSGNSLVGHKEFVLNCRNGEQFILSADLTNSDELVAQINRRMAPATTSFDSSIRTGDGFFDMPATMMGFALLLAVLIGPIRWLLFTSQITTAGIIANCVIPASFAIIPLAWWWFIRTKVPQLIRIGSSGISLQTRANKYLVRWDEVTAIRKIGFLLLLRSRAGWFVMLADRKEPVIQNLLDRGNKLLSSGSTKMLS
jgi:hypothetical protein